MTNLQKPKDLPQLDLLSDRELLHLATVHQNTNDGNMVCKVLYQKYLANYEGNHGQTMNQLKVM